MGDQRDGGIAWTDETWGPVRGCSRVSLGCVNCYAERMAGRFAGTGGAYEGLVRATSTGPRWTGTVRLVPEHLGDPLRWKRPRRVFVNSMSDLFHESLTNEQIAAIFGVMAAAPQHTFQVLTKRAKRMREWFAWASGHGQLYVTLNAAMSAGVQIPEHLRHGLTWPLPNVWIGVSVEDQQTADERVPELLRCPAAVRFVSYEPALECVDFTDFLRPEAGPLHFGGPAPSLDWIIVGGESGPGARPFDLAWARQTISQCREAGVPVFVKQLGARSYDGEAPGAVVPNEARVLAVSEKGAKAVRAMPGFVRHLSDRAGANPAEWPEDLRVREFPEVQRGA